MECADDEEREDGEDHELRAAFARLRANDAEQAVDLPDHRRRSLEHRGQVPADPQADQHRRERDVDPAASHPRRHREQRLLERATHAHLFQHLLDLLSRRLREDERRRLKRRRRARHGLQRVGERDDEAVDLLFQRRNAPRARADDPELGAERDRSEPEREERYAGDDVRRDHERDHARLSDRDPAADLRLVEEAQRTIEMRDVPRVGARQGRLSRGHRVAEEPGRREGEDEAAAANQRRGGDAEGHGVTRGAAPGFFSYALTLSILPS